MLTAALEYLYRYRQQISQKLVLRCEGDGARQKVGRMRLAGCGVHDTPARERVRPPTEERDKSALDRAIKVARAAGRTENCQNRSGATLFPRSQPAH